MNDTMLPQNIGRGELARLIPVVSDSNKENKATSALLATLMGVPAYARNMLSVTDCKINTRSKIQCFTEIVFLDKNGKSIDVKGSDRPDGIIIVKNGKNTWSALIEAKIDSADLEVTQVERYLDLARTHNINSVITISNQYANIETHHPLKVNGQKTRSVNLHHWSWKSLLTEATLHTDSNKDVKDINDETQYFILNEFKRFLEHKSTGVTEHVQMNKSWTVICSEGGLEKKTEDMVNAVMSWHNLSRDLVLSLSERTCVDVIQIIPRKYTKEKEGYNEKLKDDVEELYKSGFVSSSFNIADAASNLLLLANIREKYFSVSMTLRVSKDAKTAQGAIGWLVKQLRDVDLKDIHITACYAGKNSNKKCSLENLLEDGYRTLNDSNKNVPHSFDIYLKKNLKLSEIRGVRKFTEIAKKSTFDFYSIIGENLKKAHNKAPKISIDKKIDEIKLIEVNIKE